MTRKIFGVNLGFVPNPYISSVSLNHKEVSLLVLHNVAYSLYVPLTLRGASRGYLHSKSCYVPFAGG